MINSKLKNYLLSLNDYNANEDLNNKSLLLKQYSPINLVGGKATEAEIDDFISKVDWNKKENTVITDNDGKKIPVVPTIMLNIDGDVYGLVYSSKESLKMALKKSRAIMYSRSRKEIWVKSPTELDKPTLLSVTMDCDRDALIFKTVRHGNFCHLNKPSCFEDTPTISIEEEPIRIGVPTGDYKDTIYKFLDNAGIHIYPHFNKRVDDMIVKTSVYPNLKIIPAKPKSIRELFENKIINAALCFDDNMEDYKGEIEKEAMKKNIIKIKSTINKITICAVKKIGKSLPKIPKIVSEYSKETTEKWLQETKIIDQSSKKEVLKNIKYIYHTEGLVGEFFDISILIVNSGASLVANDLEKIEDIWELTVCMYIYKDTYKNNPRFFRYMRNLLTPNELHFYSVDDEDVGFMSNFYPSPFTDSNGTEWKTSEHYYQAYKFKPGTKEFERIRNTTTARECYKVAWEYKESFTDLTSSNPKEPSKEWADRKDKIMREALHYKFDQNPDLKQKLLDTGDKILIEHAMRDAWYGTGEYEGETYVGKNMLGVILMELRDEYRQKSLHNLQRTRNIVKKDSIKKSSIKKSSIKKSSIKKGSVKKGSKK
jgi:ribA/ribD-fused uncharacterized protein